ncbi:MAG: signal peptidase II [Pseudoramibacter sp.]|jgi:signal peptidase II
MIFYAIVIAVCVAFDQIVKALAVRFLAPVTTVPIIPRVFHLTYIENTGAAFSIFAGKSIFLIVLTSALIAVLIWLLVSLPKTKAYLTMNTAFALVIGGAVGNLIDRIRLGYVVDFFDFRLIGFAIFNVADCFVVVGCALIMIQVIKNSLHAPD